MTRAQAAAGAAADDFKAGKRVVKIGLVRYKGVYLPVRVSGEFLQESGKWM